MKSAELLTMLQDEVHRQLDFVVQHFQNLNQDAAAFSPAPDRWSASMHLQHINTYMEHYLPLLDAWTQKSVGSDTESRYSPGWLGNRFHRMVHPIRGSKKYKAMKRHQPVVVSLEPYAIVAEHINHLECLLMILQKATSLHLNSGSIPTSIHPILRLSAGDALFFLVLHQARHLIAASEICHRRDLAFPLYCFTMEY